MSEESGEIAAGGRNFSDTIVVLFQPPFAELSSNRIFARRALRQRVCVSVVRWPNHGQEKPINMCGQFCGRNKEEPELEEVFSFLQYHKIESSVVSGKWKCTHLRITTRLQRQVAKGGRLLAITRRPLTMRPTTITPI